MMKRLITAIPVVMAFAGATAYAAVTPIPPDQYPQGCHPDGEALQGNNAADLMEGTSRRDLLRGGGGIDSIFGSIDADCLFGETGEFDYIDGGPGADTISGGPGEDRINGQNGDDAISGGTDKDEILAEGEGSILRALDNGDRRSARRARRLKSSFGD